jgi:hypothetical protein
MLQCHIHFPLCRVYKQVHKTISMDGGVSGVNTGLQEQQPKFSTNYALIFDTLIKLKNFNIR